MNGTPNLSTTNSALPTSSAVSRGHMQQNGPYTVQEKHATNTSYQTSTSNQLVNNLGFQNVQQLSNGYPTSVYSTSSNNSQHVSSSYQPSPQTLTCESTSISSNSIHGASSTTHSNLTSSSPLSASLTSPGIQSPGIGIPSSCSIPVSLANFQIDPQTGMPLSIINSQNCATLKSNSNQSNVPQPDSESFESRSKPSGMLLTSRDPVLSAVPLASETFTTNLPSQPLTVSVSTTSSMSVSSPPLLSPSLMSPGLLSPSRHFSLLSPSELRKSSQLGSGLSGLGSVKVSLLLEPGAFPQPPDLPTPPCPIEKLSPPTPSICVST